MSPASKRAGTIPERITVRAQQVGFGDCFLISFAYAAALEDGRSERHVLIDFGSTQWPKSFKPRYAQIAAGIAERTGGKLDVLVVTHRHKDHISGFGDEKAAAVIKGLEPSLVIRPWTEDPAAAAEATGPAPPGEDSLGFANGLRSAQAFAEEVGEAIPAERRGLGGDLRDLARHQLANQDAVDCLDRLAKGASSGARYLHAGAPSGIEELIPGVGVKVLGPPTVEQWPEVAGQRQDDPEYWIGQRGVLGRLLAASQTGAGNRAVEAQIDDVATDPGPVRWLVERMRDQQTHSLLRIVRSLDDALNNTSVILGFEIGKRRLLFPGDAQIENWSYSLQSPEAKELRAGLEDVDLYKVGHHGSRNATPRSLVAKWQEHTRPLASMMSTLPGVHGESEATAVPRKTLTAALEGLGPLYRTDELALDLPFLEIGASTSGTEPFEIAT
ncbi:MAG: MBL fold metallo-hydrolase [Gemmatimonadetes bacterium]|nr:MBL fold metallo-hydrolase [Gemmatimonadota bacterium]